MTESERQMKSFFMYLIRLIKQDIWNFTKKKIQTIFLLLNNLIENIVRVHRHIMQIKE